MSLKKEWITQTDWEKWDNYDPAGLVRPVNGKMYLPYSPFSGFNISGIDPISKYSIGQRYTEDSSTRLNDEGTALAGPMVLNGASDVRSQGLYFASPSAYGQPTDGDLWDSFMILHSGISCWFKSTVTDYSNQAGAYIWSISKVGEDNYQCGLFVDTDNCIKAGYYDGAFINVIEPFGGSVEIDNNWHYAVFLYGIFRGTGTVILFVDEPADLTEESSLPARTIGFIAGSQFVVGSRLSHPTRGFVGYIDEITTTLLSNNDIREAVIAPNRFDAQIFVSDVIDTEIDDARLAGFLSSFESENRSSVQFSIRSGNDRFDKHDTSPAWPGFTPATQLISDERTDASTFGFSNVGRYQQIRLLLKPSSDELRVVTPELTRLELTFSRKERNTGLNAKAFGQSNMVNVAVNLESS